MLEQEVVQNAKIAELALIEIKVIIAKSLAKIQLASETENNQVLSLKTREVLVPTTHPGTGPDNVHPLKVEFNNPISVIFDYNSAGNCTFASKDGSIGGQKAGHNDQ